MTLEVIRNPLDSGDITLGAESTVPFTTNAACIPAGFDVAAVSLLAPAGVRLTVSDSGEPLVRCTVATSAVEIIAGVTKKIGVVVSGSVAFFAPGTGDADTAYTSIVAVVIRGVGEYRLASHPATQTITAQASLSDRIILVLQQCLSGLKRWITDTRDLNAQAAVPATSAFAASSSIRWRSSWFAFFNWERYAPTKKKHIGIKQ